jgi:hypothetical protein
MAGIYRRLYDFVAGYEAMREIKARNPIPRFGKNHHQWLTPPLYLAANLKPVPMVRAAARDGGAE